jgi:hypothetical protein
MDGRKLGLIALMVPLACARDDARADADASADGATGVSDATSPSDTGGANGSGGVDGSSGGPATTTSPGTTGSASADTAGEAPKFDVPQPDGGGGERGCECGNQSGFSYIWVANSNQSSVSKINTETLTEEGRYLTRMDSAGNPSRTSVSIDGHAVAVANRNGGVVKVWAREEYCDPNANGQPGVQTSTGPADILAWGQDDCIDWFVPFAYTTQRPVAWHPGVQNEDTCAYENQQLWTSGCNFANGPNVFVHLLDGETGVEVDQTEVVGFPCSGFGAYGGAIDPNGDFWISENASMAHLARITHDGLVTNVWQAPITGYGMTVDSNGYPWIAAHYSDVSNAAAARFDPMSETWDLADNHSVKTWSGMAEDLEGNIWMNYTTFDGVAGGGIVPIDRDTLEVGTPVDFPALTQYPPDWMNGISVDKNGYIWAVSPPQNTAFRYDPIGGGIDAVGGLVFPYTYSDMTGSGIQGASCGSPEG